MIITNEHAKAFTDLMSRLMADQGFEHLSRYNQSRVWLDYIKLREGHYTSILEWLLSPQEGHGLRDFFLKRLMIAATSQALAKPDTELYKQINDRIQGDKWLTIDQIYTVSMDHAIIGREVLTSDDKGRADLLIVDPHASVIIVIERKDGSYVSHGQLEKYQEWIEKNYGDYYQLFILSDSWGRNHQLAGVNAWVQLDDSWLIEVLKEALLPGRLPPDVQCRLEDLLYLFDSDGEYRDPFYRGIERELNEFSLRHRTTIKQLRGNPIAKIRSNAAIANELCKERVNKDPGLWKAVAMACRYQTLLAYLINVESLRALADSLKQRYSTMGLVIEIYDNKLNVGTQIMQSACDTGLIEQWPAKITISVPHEPGILRQDQNTSVATKPGYIELALDLQAFDDYGDERMSAVAKKYQLTTKRRWASKSFELPPCDLMDIATLKELGEWIHELGELAIYWSDHL